MANELILHLNAFSAEIEIQRVRIGEDQAEMLASKAEELREATEDWKREIADLRRELEWVLLRRLDEATQETQRTVSELEALRAELGVMIWREENLITIIITIGDITLKEASSCVTALMLEKPAIAALVGNFKKEILKHFEIEMTPDRRVSMLIAPHTPAKLVLVEAEELLARIISERMRGGATPRTMAHFLALITVEHELFGNGPFPGVGVGIVFGGYHKITCAIEAPGMDDWKWWDADISWTHELPPPLLARLLIAPRLRIRAFDVDWGRAAHWEHNLVRADGFRLGMMTGTPPGVEGRRWNNAWSVSEFDIPLALIKDGRVAIDVDVDSRHTQRTWVVWIDWSKLEFLRVEMRPWEVTTYPHILEAAREWLRQENIGRENVGERPRIWVWRTVSRIEDGDDVIIEEPIVVGLWPHTHRVRMKGLDTPEMREAPGWPGQTCENQYFHAARAKRALQNLIRPGDKVRIESYYPFGIDGLRRIEGFVFRNGRDIARKMICGGYGVAAIVCAEGTSHWYHRIVGDRKYELLKAMYVAREADRGIWHSAVPLLLHPYYYRKWHIPPRITLEDALRLSRIKLAK